MSVRSHLGWKEAADALCTGAMAAVGVVVRWYIMHTVSPPHVHLHVHPHVCCQVVHAACTYIVEDLHFVHDSCTSLKHVNTTEVCA